MKILIVSDTHGRLENLERVIEMTKPIDALIHLGDVEGQEDYIRRLVPCAPPDPSILQFPYPTAES